MSVRGIAIRSGPRPALAVPIQARPRSACPATVRAAWADDHRLIGVKLVLIGLLFLAAMALEVPW
jgi:hypothetical protein